MYAMISFENINNVEEQQQTDACGPGFRYTMDRGNVSAAAKLEGGEGGDNSSQKKKEKLWVC